MHYMVIEKENGFYVRAEKPHDPGDDFEKRELLAIEEYEHDFWAKKLEGEFDYFVDKYLSKPAVHIKPYKMSDHGIKMMAEFLRQMNKNPAFMNYGDIAAFDDTYLSFI